MPGALKESSPQTSLNRLLGPIQIYQVGISVLISSLAGLSGKIQDFQLSLKFRLVRNEFLPKPKNICSNWDTLIFEFNRTSLLFFFPPVSCFSQSGNLPPGVLCLRLRTRVEGDRRLEFRPSRLHCLLETEWNSTNMTVISLRQRRPMTKKQRCGDRATQPRGLG